MITSLLYIIFAILALSFLIFIHELGHYFMAKKVGMKVDAFGIGIGKSIITWRKNETDWNIGWLPFGGYVKIAGVDTDSNEDLAKVPGGYFSKGPLDRIKVAAMGPIVNLVFALLLFTVLWAVGGREKNFSDYTKKIGWVDPKSELYALGVRPGDEITAYDNYQYQSSKDHLYGPMTGNDIITVKGFKVDYKTGSRTAFDYKIATYPHPSASDKGILTAGVIAPASYLVYQPIPVGAKLPESSPMATSGIEPGDRIVWADGEEIFSLAQLMHLLNDKRSLLTIQRGNETLLRRVPRIEVDELKIDSEVKAELNDWQHAANLNDIKFPHLYTIPYNLTADCVVENPLKLIDSELQNEFFPKEVANSYEEPLLPGDKIIAIDGTPVSASYELISQLQSHKVNIIVERNKEAVVTLDKETVEKQFENEVNWKDIEIIAKNIGNDHGVKQSGNLYLLKQIEPKMRSQISLAPETQAQQAHAIIEQKKESEANPDPDKRAAELRKIENFEKQYILGLPNVQDRKVTYNPNPFQQFVEVFDEIKRTFEALFTGNLNPKWISGPVGIVQVVQNSWQVSFKEVIFWVAAISLNLGALNLLPLPVLDGGYICLFLFELITRKKINPKTIEKMIVPFFVLIAGFILYITYNDVARIFSQFVNW